MPSFRLPILAAALFLLLITSAAGADGAGPLPPSEYRLRNSVVGCAGAPVSDAEYRMAGTLAQPAPTGVAAASPGVLYAGFWWKPGWTASVLGTGPDGTPAYGLHQNHPNPFGRSTAIAFSLAAECRVDLTVYDVTGRKVKCLIDEVTPAGNHSITWDGRDRAGAGVSPGVYFYRLRAGSFEMVKKMLVLQ